MMKRIARFLWLPVFLAAAGLLPSPAGAAPAALQEKKVEERKLPEGPKAGGPTPAGMGADRVLAQKIANFERVYRNRMARIRRLTNIYEKQGNAEKIAELRDLQQALEKRHANAMKGFREQLGEERWTRLQKEIRPANANARFPSRTPPEQAGERPKEAPKEPPKREEPKKEERPKEKPPGGGR